MNTEIKKKFCLISRSSEIIIIGIGSKRTPSKSYNYPLKSLIFERKFYLPLDKERVLPNSS